MSEPNPICIGCGDLLDIPVKVCPECGNEEQQFLKDQPGYEMGERVMIITCSECGKEQRVEKFAEVSWQSFELDDDDQPPAEEEESTTPEDE